MTKVLLFNQAGTYTVHDLPQNPETIIALVHSGMASEILPAAHGSMNVSLQGEIIIISPRFVEETNHLIPENELKALLLLSSGLTSKQIGVQMGLSTRTVDGYITKLMLRFNAKSRAHLVAITASLGLLCTGLD